MDDKISALKEQEKEQAAEERSPARHNNWIGGVILIAVGVVFLLRNFLGFALDNWWALFILIPAVLNFGRAWNSYQRHGRLSASGRGALIGGLLISTVAFVFLLNLSWGTVWPVFIIIIGIGALLNGLCA